MGSVCNNTMATHACARTQNKWARLGTRIYNRTYAAAPKVSPRIAESRGQGSRFVDVDGSLSSPIVVHRSSPAATDPVPSDRDSVTANPRSPWSPKWGAEERVIVGRRGLGTADAVSLPLSETRSRRRHHNRSQALDRMMSASSRMPPPCHPLALLLTRSSASGSPLDQLSPAVSTIKEEGCKGKNDLFLDLWYNVGTYASGVKWNQGQLQVR